jgi:transposase
MLGGYTLGHDARLMPARYVRPYSKSQKNHFRDAEAHAEAAQRPTMKLATTKAADQLDLQSLHRFRERLVTQCTGIIDQVRAFFAGTRYCGPTGATLFADGVAAHPGHPQCPP